MQISDIKTINELKEHLVKDLMLPNIEIILPAIDVAYWFGRNDVIDLYQSAVKDAANNT